MNNVGLQKICLRDFCLIKSSSRVFAKEYVEKGIPFFRSKDVIDKSLGIFKKYDLYISESRFKELRAISGSPSDGDLLISSVGNRSGQAYVVDGDGDFYFKDGNIIWISEFDGLDPHFLCYFFNSAYGQKMLKSIMIGSAQKAITIDSLRNLEISIPSLSYQKSSKRILRTLDKKIELNQQMNETLEEIAKTLFKSWFIDFDPVRAKADGRPTGLSKEISDLFPNSFESSELGEIPKGWDIASLDDITSKLTTGLNPRKNFVLGSGDNFYVTIKNLGDFEVVLDDKCDKVDDDAIKKINSRSDLKQNDILFSGIGTIGKVVYVFDKAKNWNISESVFSLRANSEVTFSSFLYQLLKSYPLQGYVQALAGGSVQKGIRMGSLKEYKFILSNFEVQRLFHETISPMIEKISLNLNETKNLINIRDTLLPNLISGKLKVSDVENFIEEAGV
jgi:type I restriction enzyme, S subunit